MRKTPYFNLTMPHTLEVIYIAYYLYRDMLTKEQVLLCQRIIDLQLEHKI